MEFDFLPKLPNSNLDDRTFKDLVEECLLRIPRYCPEWTNYNPSDPGVTLIELFAWLTDQMQLRFNQVPRRNYVGFLELLGIRLQPPTAARTELTFYLTTAQPFPLRVPRGTEVATERTATEEAIVFSIDRDLIMGNPRVRHFLSAETVENQPSRDRLPNRFSNTLNEQNFDWREIEETPLFTAARSGNCFYLVLDTPPGDEEQSIHGNVLEIHFRGEPATGTGINPDFPPRVWQAWDGKTWRPILRQELDDKTKGFNFDAVEPQAQNGLREASVILHLPENLPQTNFDTDYHGHWIRCVYQPSEEQQQLYSTSPRIVGLAVQSIGGTVGASQCIRVQEELIGISSGKPGQTFQLQMQPVLERQPDEEYLEVRPPGQVAESWEEVTDFSNSSPESLHYTIDSRTGNVQFGPLIRGPRHIKRRTYERAQIQAPFQTVIELLQRENGRAPAAYLPALPDIAGRDTAFIERQYGKVPPVGSEIYMTAYRFGGGKQGDVQAEKLIVLRSSLPYISRVINYQAAEGGADQESLEEAVMRVPQLLRTRECAVIPEDFENVAKRLPGKRIARAHCVTNLKYTTPGVVRLLLAPQVDIDHVDWTQGVHPDQALSLGADLRQDLEAYMSDRRPIGVQVKLEEPDYVGVSANVHILLEQRYNNPRDREEAEAKMATDLKIALYKFLNPLTGGVEGQGWPLGRPVYVSDVISLCQKVPGIRHVGSVQIFEVRKQEDGWNLFEAIDSLIEPGPFGCVCSWAGGTLSFHPRDKSDPCHEIHFME